MRLLLLLPALVLVSCGRDHQEPQRATPQPAAAAEPEPEATVATTVAFTEGPAQGPDGLIYFTDVTNNRILRFEDRKDGRLDIVCSAELEMVSPVPKRAHQGWRYYETDAAAVKAAPHTMPVRRLDDVRAARQLDVAWKPAAA